MPYFIKVPFLSYQQFPDWKKIDGLLVHNLLYFVLQHIKCYISILYEKFTYPENSIPLSRLLILISYQQPVENFVKTNERNITT